MGGNQLELELTDVAGAGVNDEILFQLSGSIEYTVRMRVARNVIFRSLPQGVLQVRIDPTCFHSQEIEVTFDFGSEEKQLTVPLYVRASMAGGIRAAAFDQLDSRVQEILDKSAIKTRGTTSLRGAELYGYLEPEVKATFLNICAKAASTRLSTGVPCLNVFRRVKSFERDGVVFAGSIPDEETLPLRTQDERAALRLDLHGNPSRRRNVLIRASLEGAREAVETASSPYIAGQVLERHQHIRPQYELIRTFDYSGSAETDPVIVEVTSGKPGSHPRTRGFPQAHFRPEAASRDKTPADPLQINNWLENDAGERGDMETPLESGRAYSYWFEIAESARTGATTETFTEPSELAAKPESTMRIEVMSGLLACGKIVESRTVKYRRGQGIAPVSFDLLARPGTYDLLVNVIHGQNRVYSRSWSFDIQGSMEGEPKPPPHLDNALGIVLLTQLKSPSQLSISAPGNPSVHDECPIGEAGFADLCVGARQILNRFADSYSSDENGRVDQTAALSMLCEMARWGYDAYNALFPPDGKLRSKLEMLPVITSVDVDSPYPCFPWEWLFTGLPPARPEKLSVPETTTFLEGFWGYRFRIWLIVRPADWMLVTDTIENAEGTRVLSAVNPETDARGGPRNLAYVESLKELYNVANHVCRDRATTIDALREDLGGRDKPHVLYFYCHHQPGKQLKDAGYFGFGDSTLFMKKEKEEPISRWDLLNLKLPPFPRGDAPLVFLNACGTAQGQEFYPAGFIPYFATQMNAKAVIGTQAEVNTVAAYLFARDLLDFWFKGQPLADALFSVRRAWLRPGQLNPYAMYYTIYGDGRTRLRLPAST